MCSGKVVWPGRFFFLVFSCLICLVHASLPKNQEGKIICTLDIRSSEKSLPDAHQTLACHATGYEQVYQTVAGHKISTLSYPVSLHCPKAKPSSDNEGFIFTLRHTPPKTPLPDRPDLNDSANAFPDEVPLDKSDDFSNVDRHIPPVNFSPFQPSTFLVPVFLFSGSMAAVEATLSVKRPEPEKPVPATHFSPAESSFRVLPADTEGTFWVYTLNAFEQWDSPFAINLQDLPVDNYPGAIMALVSALSARSGEQAPENNQAALIPGIIQAMIGGSAQSVSTSDSGRAGNQEAGQSSQPPRDEEQAGDQAEGGDDEEEKEEPPANPVEFIKSRYYQLNLDPALLALGFGLNPFAPRLEELTVMNVIHEADRSGVLQRMFHFALHYHNQIVGGHTGVGQWIHPQGLSECPAVPTLFYLAQIQPLNYRTLATLLGLAMPRVDNFVQSHPGNRRLWQLYVMDLAAGRATSWKTIIECVQKSQATLEPQPEPGATASLSEATAPAEVIVTQTYHKSTLQLDQQINSRIRQLKAPTEKLNTSSSRKQIFDLNIPQRMMRVFFAALGVAPHLTRGMRLVFQGTEIGRQRIADFGWNHVAVALHVAGCLHSQNAQALQPYIQQYGHILAPPITSPEISYYSLREEVENLLSRLAEASAQQAEASPQPSQPPQQPPQNQCSVCLEENQQLVIFSPCHHKRVCKTCAEMLDKCPECRKPIKEKIYKVYD